MRVIKNRILLKAVESEKADIIRPSDIDYYEVKFVGKEVEEVKVGDKVFYQQGVKINIKGEQYILIDEDDIVAIF